jgi:1-acyl-sn-glycerol-3-phosphate acyltransferase
MSAVQQEKEVKVLHRVIRQLAHWAVVSFFHRVHIIGAENVPQDGPLIVCVPWSPELLACTYSQSALRRIIT